MGFTLTTFYGVLSYGILAHSQDADPKDKTTCSEDFNAGMNAVKRDWDVSLQALIDQEIPASEMVADAYESMRTYNCWLGYICRAVEYSGHASLESISSKEDEIYFGLRSEHIGTLPGCQAPEAMKMGKEWDSFVNQMKKTPIVGITIEPVENYYASGKMNYFPSCMTDPKHKNANPQVSEIARNFRECKQALELRFNCKVGDEEPSCTEKSNAFVKIDNILKKAHGDQKARALEGKLGTIVPKLQTMEVHVGYLSSFLQKLNTRLACFAPKCT